MKVTTKSVANTILLAAFISIVGPGHKKLKNFTMYQHKYGSDKE